jgi:hypothetical protein
MSLNSHPGFDAVASRIAAKENLPAGRAAAILAASTRKASPHAKKKNPRLNKVRTKAPKDDESDHEYR